MYFPDLDTSQDKSPEILDLLYFYSDMNINKVEWGFINDKFYNLTKDKIDEFIKNMTMITYAKMEKEVKASLDEYSKQIVTCFSEKIGI